MRDANESDKRESSYSVVLLRMGAATLTSCHFCIRSFRNLEMLDLLFDVADEACRSGAVQDAMIEGER